MLKIIGAEMRGPQREDKAVKGRVYFFPEGESIYENLEKRYARPYEAFRKLLPEVFERVGFGASEAAQLAASSKWSQKAGCGCGCSPGFIVKGLTGGESLFVHITE